jgi:hypothetical protein
MAKSMDIEYTVVKFLKVLAPGYGIAYNVHIEINWQATTMQDYYK